jgi:hypothetical protein
MENEKIGGKGKEEKEEKRRKNKEDCRQQRIIRS